MSPGYGAGKSFRLALTWLLPGFVAVGMVPNLS